MNHLITSRLISCLFALLLVISLGNTASQESEKSNTRTRQLIPFEETPIGQVPGGWKLEATHPARELAQWSVVNDPNAPPTGDHVLSVKIPHSDRGTFNLLWTDQVSFQNGVIEIKVRAGTGKVDQGGGPIWRVKDQNNYYIARWNPLENNFRVYYVKDGKRVQLDSADVDVSASEWHTIRIDHGGDQITGFLDGKKLLEVTDSAFPEGGGVGLWTKADAASFFDDLVIERRERR